MNKREKLEIVRQSLLEKIYQQALELNLDPDSFDSQAFVTWHDEGAGGVQDIGHNLKKLQIIERKLEEIA